MEDDYVGMPMLGEKIPSFKAQTTHGKMEFPKDMHGNWWILFSHPADFTPVCTTEFIAFQKRFDKFAELNCKLVGLSIDQVFSHIKWVEWMKEELDIEIKFPIIADDGTVAYLFGMIHPEKDVNTVRTVFIVDSEGILRAMLFYPQELGRNMDEILRMVRNLQIADKHKVALPANWPENELIGKKVILPPPNYESLAKKRLADPKCECYDWWFCYKDIEE
ncbi:MAG: peroxiredoxin [Candidatus Heimdallarchaeaceae archaeon]